MKKAAREGTVAIGVSLGEFGTRGIAKLLEYADLDWVMIDMEHSGYTMDRVADLIAWFKATDITVIVRPPDNVPYFLSGIMDAGAMGVQVAFVETAEDARKIVDGVMYAPLGSRGVGLNSAHTDFLKPKAADYMPLRNSETSIVAAIESKKGLDNVEEIAAVEGIDFLHPGQTDLSVALGIPGQFDHPKYKEALHRTTEACKRYGKSLAFNPDPNDATSIETFYNLGCRMMGLGNSINVFQNALKGNADLLRRQIGKAVKPAR